MCPAVPTTTDFTASRLRVVGVASLAASTLPRSLVLAGAALALGRPLVLRPCLRAPRPALSVANPFQDVDETEIDLPHFHVDAYDLDSDLVAQPVDLLRILAAQHMCAFDKSIVVVGHCRHVDEPFDEVLD